MAKKYNIEQQQAIFNEEQNRIDAIRRTSISNNDKKAVTQIVQAERSLREEIDATVKAADTFTKQIEKQKEKTKELIEQRKAATGEEKKRLQLQIDSSKQHEQMLQKLLEENKIRQLAKNTSLEQLDALKTEFNYTSDTIEAERRRLQIKEEQLKADEIALDYAKDIDKYTLKSYRDTEKQIKNKEKELKLLEDEYELLSDKDKDTEYGKSLKGKIDSIRKLKDELVNDKNNIFKGLTSSDKIQAETLGITDLTYEVKQGFKQTFSSMDSFEDTIVNAVNASRNFFNGIVDGTVNSISQYYGPITAALEGVNSGLNDFKSVNKSLQSDIGLSSLVKQEAVLNSINNLVSQGITSDIESLGILTSIRDKTVSSFDVTNSDLRRLVRLNQQRGNLTAKQFGLADALKESFNSTFGDSSFLNNMFQSLTGTVLDAVSANANSGGTDSTAFYSVLESWLGAMYESGVDTNTVNAIAQGINYLGSGNVQALSGNKQLQNLMLLSMDRAGLDYADILQRGLSDSNMNVLLSTIVDYLAEITSNTKENNVLQSSYANLFNMSITDMTAIQNLSKSGYSALGMSGGSALAQASNELNKVASRTSTAEQINNVIDNAKYAFGSSIAANKLAYFTYKTSNLILDSLDGLSTTTQGSGTSKMMQKVVGKVFDNITGPVRLVTSLTYLGSLLPGVLGFGKSLIGSASNLLNGDGNNALAEIINQSASGGLFDGGTSNSGVFSLTSSGKSSNALKQFTLTSSTQASGITDTTSWENDAKAAAEEQDENTKILKEFEKTLMKAKDSDGYAFAVSLQGMSDGVLRSFASIFADEDAMLETMTGKNNALEKNNTFIDYLEKNASTTNTNDSSKKI